MESDHRSDIQLAGRMTDIVKAAYLQQECRKVETGIGKNLKIRVIYLFILFYDISSLET